MMNDVAVNFVSTAGVATWIGDPLPEYTQTPWINPNVGVSDFSSISCSLPIYYPQHTVSISDDKYVVIVLMPGHNKNGIEIAVEDTKINIKSKNLMSDFVNKFKFGNGIVEVDLDITLPGPCIETGAEASYENGVLCISLTKFPSKKTKKIKVK